MAKKSTKKPSEDKKASIQASIEVGRDVGGNIIVGEGNTININAEQNVFRSLHQLPQPPADFTGRKNLIDDLLEDFKKSKGATITGKSIQGLTGMGGIGKTALGLKVAHKIAENYPDAQIFLGLKGTTEPLTAVDIARHVILSIEPTADLRALDETNMQGAYQSVLHGKKALLFFDNARSADQIAPLRPPETCAMLVTSRWTFSVPGLQPRRVDVMGEDEAKDFLLELCPRIGDSAAELAKACAYLPLALRIAGSFLQINSEWSIEKYLTQLNDRKGRLATLQESRAEAELTTEPDLLATFELSYNALSEENQKQWRMLGVFPATFTSTAAQDMWMSEENEATKILGLFKRYNLLEFDENLSRYSLHDLLNDYALSQMVSDEKQEARLKHASHYKDALNAANDLYLEGNENILLGLKLFDLEWENIQAGQAWTTRYFKESKEIAELCGSFTNLTYCINLRLLPRDLILWHEAALAADQYLSNKQGEGVDLVGLGLAYAALGDVKKAIHYYERALVILRETGDRRNEGVALVSLGIAYAALGDDKKAIHYYEQALVIARETGDRRNEGVALGNLGRAHADLGDDKKAIHFYEQRMVIARETGDRQYEGVALGNLGRAHADLGDDKKAIHFYEQGLVIAREIGNRRGEGISLFNLGLALHRLGEKEQSIDLIKQALKIYEAIESPSTEEVRHVLKLWGVEEE